MGRNAAEQCIEFGVELVAIGSQGGVGERRTAAPDCAGSLQQRAETRSKSNIAGVGGILGVADEMGEADLVVATGPAQLRAEAIGDPEGGADVAEEFYDHVLAAARTDDEATILTVMEGPQPPVPLADPHAGLIRLQHTAGEQTGADQAPLPGEGRPAVGQHGDQGAFADRKPEQIGHQPSQPLERDRMDEPQIDDQGPQVRPKRRAGGMSAGASARNGWPQQGQSPRYSVTRVTPGLIGGSSMWS